MPEKIEHEGMELTGYAEGLISDKDGMPKSVARIPLFAPRKSKGPISVEDCKKIVAEEGQRIEDSIRKHLGSKGYSDDDLRMLMSSFDAVGSAHPGELFSTEWRDDSDRIIVQYKLWKRLCVIIFLKVDKKNKKVMALQVDSGEVLSCIVPKKLKDQT